VLKRQHQLFSALLVVTDALVIALASLVAFLLAVWKIPGSWEPQQWESWLKEPLLFYTIPTGIIALWYCGMYRPRRDRSLYNEALLTARAGAAVVLALLPVLYLFTDVLVKVARPGSVDVLGIHLSFMRLQLVLLTLSLATLLTVHRLSFRTFVRWMRRRGFNQRHVAVIGVGRLGQVVTRTLERNSWTGIRVAYFLSHQDSTRRGECLGRPVRGGLEDIERALEIFPVDAVYVALPVARSNLLSEVLGRLERFPTDVRVVPDLNPRYLPQNMAVSELDGMPILSYRECPTHGFGGVIKRGLDVAGSLLALAIFSPAMLAAAVLVRMSGPGPVIFKQKRVSLGGQEFEIYKFRTMHHAEDETLAATVAARSTTGWTERDDPRITRAGRLLRRTSLDELPQLFNVVSGDMSLVGPRPERPELIARFREDWRGYMLRQHVKAGITGWAQVNGLRGQTSLRKRLQYDLFYIRHWSVTFDLKILLLTVFRGFVHKNAH
jgi:Undecaprenyl-phosphate glucose phosphotransferase